METAVQRNKFVLAGEEPCEFQCAFDCLRTAVTKKCFGEIFSGRDVRDFSARSRNRLHMVKI